MSSHSRIERLVLLVAAIKGGEYPSAGRFVEKLPPSMQVSRKTIHRDLKHLCRKLGAPIKYDPTRHGYFLQNPSWTFPYEELQGHALWSMLLCGQISQGFLPAHLRTEASEVLNAQIAVAELDGLSVDALRAIITATGARAPIPAKTFDTVSQACRECRTLHLRYQATLGKPTERDVDVHALFLSDGAWYARVRCHLRKALRSLALHRIEAVELTDRTFTRSNAVVTAVRDGHVFDQQLITTVTVRGSKDKALILSEREWFPNQTITELPDGRIELRFRNAPADEVLWWVLSYAGHLEVLAPQDFRARVRKAAETIAAAHQPDSLPFADGKLWEDAT